MEENEESETAEQQTEQQKKISKGIIQIIQFTQTMTISLKLYNVPLNQVRKQVQINENHNLMLKPSLFLKNPVKDLDISCIQKG